MRSRGRLFSALALSGVLALGAAACGSSGGGGGGGGGGGSSASSGGGGGQAGGTVTWLFGTPPDSLDPGFSYTTQGVEPDWVTYTPLLTYRHENGQAGTTLIPGVAKSLPQVSSDGKTYTLQMRQGLKYSNGKPVKASDFKYAIERSIRIGWGGKSFFTSYIVGADKYDAKKANDIPGIQTNDKTGKITIRLSQPYGAFSNVIAFPASAPVPSGTPMKNEPSSPPPGVGPYMITNVQPNQGYTLKKNPTFASFHIPDIPTGHLDTINVKFQSNTNAEAQSVLNNQADVFDPADTVPPAYLTQIQSKAQDRFAKKTTPSTFYFFLNTKLPPFNNPKARQAVNMALDKSTMVKLASGFLKPTCHFLPPDLPGHTTAPCPYYDNGDPNGKPNLAKAKQMIQQAGLAGTKVTVWGEQRQPRQQYVLYYASVLNKIGFKATPRIIADANYFPTIGNANTKAQTGFADWLQDFPNPSDFYLLLNCKSIQPVNNENFSNVCDPRIQMALSKLNQVPATQLSSVANDWALLDQYTSKQAYELVYGEELLPEFFSNRINFSQVVFHPLYLVDPTSLQLK